MELFIARRRFVAVALLGACCLSAMAESEQEPDIELEEKVEIKPEDREVSNIGKGLFHIRSLSPGHLLRPSISMIDIRRVRSGQAEMDFGVSWGNVWNYDPNHYVIDAEWLQLQWRITCAVFDHVEAGMAVTFSGRFGGFGDGPIEGFHDATGLGGTAGRDDRPRNEILVRILNDEGEEVFLLEDEAWGINDIPVFATWLVTPGNGWVPAIALTGGATLPMGDEEQLQGAGSTVYGGGILLSKRLERSRLYAVLGAGVTYGGNDVIAGIELEKAEYTGLAALECAMTDRFSLLTQMTISSPVAKDYYDFADPAHELNLGFKWDVDDNTSFEFNVTENLFSFGNTTDFGLHFGLSKTM